MGGLPRHPSPGSTGREVPRSVIHALVVDGGPQIEALAPGFLDEGVYLRCVSSADYAFRVLLAEPADVVLLDLASAGASGPVLCHMIRRESKLPIIAVLGHPGSTAAVTALDAGADHCAMHPLVAGELAARIRALLRRRAVTANPDTVRLGDVEILLKERKVSRSGREIDVTQTEFRLLTELVRAAPEVISRGELVRRVWGFGNFADTRLLDVHVCRLRNKVEPNPRRPALIRTVRGVGYQAVPTW